MASPIRAWRFLSKRAFLRVFIFSPPILYYIYKYSLLCWQEGNNPPLNIESGTTKCTKTPSERQKEKKKIRLDASGEFCQRHHIQVWETKWRLRDSWGIGLARIFSLFKWSMRSIRAKQTAFSWFIHIYRWLSLYPSTGQAATRHPFLISRLAAYRPVAIVICCLVDMATARRSTIEIGSWRGSRGVLRGLGRGWDGARARQIETTVQERNMEIVVGGGGVKKKEKERKGG